MNHPFRPAQRKKPVPEALLSDKIDFLMQEHGADTIDTMRAIKHALDPKNILNPGKIIHW